ncbi:MAG: SusC/RagA family TonB-linked outer membrane protein [Chitinophagaceae bacterium]
MMKFTILLVLAVSFQSFAKSYGQEHISLNLEKVSLKKVLKTIEQQGVCRFVYKDELLPRDQRVSISVKDASLEDVMSRILRDTELAYKKLNGNLVVITAAGSGGQMVAFPVTGKVINDRGEPLQGVNVVEMGTTNGTTTNAEGSFVLSVASGSAKLSISYIGYLTQEVEVADRSVLNIQLLAENKNMEEVIVVGYGTQKKRNVTGAISSVKATDLENMPVFRVEQSMQGRVSGLTITSASGQPGEGSTVRVRGTTTIGNSDPLYVVDGVPVNGGIDYLNQADIASIDVLKDAASAAIYGTQGANGVILITTKKGRAGAVKVNYNGFVGTQAPWRKLDLLNATEYATLMNEAYMAAGQPIRFADPSSYGKGTDWQAAVFNNNALIQNHEISLSGGSEKSTYFGSFGYLNQDGIVATSNSNYKRFTARFNSTHKIGRIASFGTNIGYTRTKSQGVGTNGEWGTPLNRAINLDPLTPVVVTDPNVANQAPYTNSPYVVRDANGNPYGISTIVTSEILNPIAALKVGQGNGWSDKLVANGFLEIEPIAGLKFRSNIGTDLAFWGDESFQPLYYLNSINQNVDLNGYTRNSNRGMYWIFENLLTYTRQFGDHNVSLMGGTSAQKNYGEQQGGTKRGIPVDNLKDASLSFSVPQDNQFFWGSEYQNALSSIFGRLTYDFDGKYLLNATVRRDGSSRFGSNNKYGVFPSVSAGWVISRENFFPVTDKVSFLKLRGSYGVNGNDRIGDFRFVSTVGGGRNYTINGQLITGFSPNAIANPDLKWESTSQLNFGLDAIVFKRLNVTLDWYSKKTYDMLLGIDVPGYVGNNGPIGNIADMENRGIELELGYNGRVGELTYSVSANVSHLRNRVTYLGDDKEFLGGQTFGPQGVEITRTMIGYPIGSFFGFKTDGLFQNWGEVNNYKNHNGDMLQPNAAPGDIRYVDINDDGVINNDDRGIIGDPTPDWSFGFTVGAAWKGFDMTLFGQGVAGNDVFQAIRRFDLPTANYTKEALGRWTGQGSSNYFPRVVLNDPNQNFSRSSDFFLKPGDYFRIKTLQIGYTFSNKALEKAGISKLRLYVMSNNLATFTRYSGFDPEIGGGSYGVDRGIYPQARSFMVGVNLGF